MYLASNLRPGLDREIEALAQVVNKNSRADGVYSTENVLAYAVAKLLARVTKARNLSLVSAIGMLETLKQEFFRKVSTAAFDKERNINGDVFSELL